MMKQPMNARPLAPVALAMAMTLAALPAVADAVAAAAATPAPTAAATQTFYASPEEAAKALYKLIKSGDTTGTDRVLGEGSEQLIYTGDEVADERMRESFLSRYEQSLKIDRVSADKAILLVGENESPFPFPLMKSAQGWQFDKGEGAEELVNRRVGENELFAMKFCLAYGDAQREYAELDRDGDGIVEYAQRFRSSEGKRDGLYWPAAEGESGSPLGPVVAQALREGYRTDDPNPISYHGYYYRILTAQGSHARGGAYDYVVRGNMIGGYALVAFPSRWGSSGVMTFVCNHDGVVYEKNLGETTAEAVLTMKAFDPDASWQKSE